MRLNPVTWEWKNDPINRSRFGLIAQDVRKILPELVEEGNDKDKMLSINYLGLLPVMIKAVQEQQVLLDAEKKANLALQTQIEKAAGPDQRH